MADIKSAEARSRNMARIRSRDTGPETWLRKELFACGFRYRKNVSSIPGHPDIWMAKYNTAVFVHGCFWHRHRGCKYAYLPKTRVEFWTEKFRKNMERDAAVQAQLEKSGIRQLVIWECAIRRAVRSDQQRTSLINDIRMFLDSDSMRMEL